MRSARYAFGSAQVGGMVYAFGGLATNEDAIQEAERFDPRTGSWERIKSMRASCMSSQRMFSRTYFLFISAVKPLLSRAARALYSDTKRRT